MIGVDLSVRLLEIARCHEQLEPRGIDYRLADARTLHGIPGAYFDGVVYFQAHIETF